MLSFCLRMIHGIICHSEVNRASSRTNAKPCAREGGTPWGPQAGDRVALWKGSGRVMDIRLCRIQPCVLAAREANSILGCSNGSAVSGWREGIIPVCSEPVRSHLDTVFSLGPLQTRRRVVNWWGFSGGSQSGAGVLAQGNLWVWGLFSLRRGEYVEGP